MRIRFVVLLGSVGALAACTGSNGVTPSLSQVPQTTAAVAHRASVVNSKVSSVSGTWTMKAPMPQAQWGFGIASAKDKNGGDAIYVVSGIGPSYFYGETQVYHPATNTWSSAATLPTGSVGLGLGNVNGILYAVGGYSYGTSIGTVEAYDPKTDRWANKTAMPTPREDFAARVINGILYVAGGDYGVQNGPVILALSTVEAYDPSTDTWTTKAPMPEAKSNGAGVVIGGVLYVFGGINQTGSLSSSVEAYDPATNTWAFKAPLPTPRYSIAGGVFAHQAFALGGQQNGTVVESYDPATNAWTEQPPLPGPREYFGARNFDGVLYAMGGNTIEGAVFNTVEGFTPSSGAAADPAPGDDSDY